MSSTAEKVVLQQKRQKKVPRGKKKKKKEEVDLVSMQVLRLRAEISELR